MYTDVPCVVILKKQDISLNYIDTKIVTRGLDSYALPKTPAVGNYMRRAEAGVTE
jgi:hypothetical protein